MKRTTKILPIISLLVLMSMACALLASPPRPEIPTPPSTPDGGIVSLDDLSSPSLNPTSSVVFTIDPDIEALMNAVSQQNLLAYVQTLEAFRTRHTFSETQRDDIGIGAARRWIYEEFLRVNAGALQVAFEDFNNTFNGLTTNQRNVIATLPGVGSDPGIIILMAHYDSRNTDVLDGEGTSPGADDNATGVAILLELARLMSARSWNKTIIFAAFAAEEQGTFGSTHFVQDYMLSGRTFEAAINNDIVGGRPGIPQSIRVFSPGPETSNSRQLARYIELVGGLYMPTFGVELVDGLDREGRYSDHREFINAGVPGVRMTESVEDFSIEHTGLDRSELLDYNYLRQVAQLNLVTIANLAGSPSMPPVPVVTAVSEGSYAITWPPDNLTAAYAISFRPLGVPVYSAPFYYVNGSEAGNVALSGLDPQGTYAVSLAALDPGGKISAFSPEVIVGPP
ncbi:MAG: M20/M25/M40 family metallo-hydrolase [Candidatus Promineifilaceae bacterium]